ncbi:MAG: ATP-binding cassette domain-containing protein [Thermoanaerobaculia bacterium]
MSEGAIIETLHLRREFGDVVAVGDLTISINSGLIFGLLGPNGAGKSSVIKMLTTLIPPTSGTARVAGFDILRDPSRVRRHIGYVPQLLSADGALTARENLLLSARLYGIPHRLRHQRIDEMLAFMGLMDVANRLVRTYSGGMIRRVELAQAMLHQPDVLFLDEPTIGLDPIARHAVWDRLVAQRKLSGTTILLTTHDMEEADVLCDSLAVLHQGNIAATGSPAELKAGIGPEATLEDVFAHYGGGTITEGGTYHDVRQTRRAARRLG